MFIQTETQSDPDVMAFLPGKTVLEGARRSFGNIDDARISPLARRIFEVGDIAEVAFSGETIEARKMPDADWAELKPAVLTAIMRHYREGGPVIDEDLADDDDSDAMGEDLDPATAEIVGELKELIAARIRPAITQAGGKIKFHSYKEGKVYLELEGMAFQMLGGIQNMLRHYVPEVNSVHDYRDALPKPGLDTPEAQQILRVLDEKINPAVAAHGGRVSLIDVSGDRAYVRLEGGCQGCGMAAVTLKQGIESEIKDAVPSIAAVLDVTDHAEGTNPYYRPA